MANKKLPGKKLEKNIVNARQETGTTLNLGLREQVPLISADFAHYFKDNVLLEVFLDG